MLKEQTAVEPSRHKVWEMFNRIAPRYDFLNRFLSMGQDVLWRRKMTRLVRPRPRQRMLDLATGTADVLLTFLKKSPYIHLAHGLDMSDKMLELADQKVLNSPYKDRVWFYRANAMQLPFVSESFDLVTMSFGIRNVENVTMALRDMYRVLKPEGRVLIMEFSLPENRIWKAIYLFYLRNILPHIGAALSGDSQAYRYLNQTVETFPYGQQFCYLMKEAQFKRIRSYPLMGGIATIYQGDK